VLQSAVIGRAGIGVDNVDVEAASRRGIIVVNALLQSSGRGGAHHRVILALCRGFPGARVGHAGRWERCVLSGPSSGKTVGWWDSGISAPRLSDGSRVRRRVVGSDPFVNAEMLGLGIQLLSLDELLETSDLVTIHVPLTRSTTTYCAPQIAG